MKNRLIEKDDSDNWALAGVSWCQLYTGQIITEELQEKIYGALYKLMKYESTDLEPSEIWELKEKSTPA